MGKKADRRDRYRGRISQIGIYLGRSFRLCVMQSDWKVLPMAALIAGLVSYVVGKTIFVTQERTLLGSFALSCVCIWNGCFNSIQTVCRERDVLKREHRAGMHITSYILSQVIYQAFLCAAQSIIMTVIFFVTKVHFPSHGVITPWFPVDFTGSLFLITLAADMLALFISCMVRSTTTAMTVMPFLLIFELVFCGGILPLSGKGEIVSQFTTARWGMTTLVAQGEYNDLPFVTAWNQLKKFDDVEIEGTYPVKDAMDFMRENDLVEPFQRYCGEKAAKEEYQNTPENIAKCWSVLFIKSVIYMMLAAISLSLIDRDKR